MINMQIYKVHKKTKFCDGYVVYGIYIRKNDLNGNVILRIIDRFVYSIIRYSKHKSCPWIWRFIPFCSDVKLVLLDDKHIEINNNWKFNLNDEIEFPADMIEEASNEEIFQLHKESDDVFNLPALSYGI